MHAAGPRLFTLPESLRSALVRVKPSALIGAAALLVVVLAIMGVRTAWAQRGAEPVPVAATHRERSDAGQPTGRPERPVTEPEPTGAGSNESAGDAAASAYVHVIGAVVEPGVVEVSAGSRVADVVEAAGGLSGDADLSRINLARVVVDAERIWVPVEGEDLPPDVVDSAPSVASAPGPPEAAATAGETTTSDATTAQIDLNTADSATLQTLPGVGPVTAESILTWRTEHGRFNTIDELLEVSGIGPRTLDKLRPQVSVGTS